ncbi:MAG: MFS transporter, partial [Betaproteobacteria bacterium]|nr:MFS transporter [Betaproteobacteria bacterium]
ALVGMLSRPDTLARNFSHYTILAWATQVCGPLLAGYAIDSVGHVNACLAILPLVVLSLVMLFVWGGSPPPGGQRGGPLFRARDVFGNRIILRVLALSCAVQLAMELFPFFLPLIGHALALSATTIGWLMATAAASAMVLCLALPPLVERYGEEPLLVWSFALSALAFALMPAFGTPLLLGMVCVLFGIGMGAGQPLSSMLMFKRSPAGQAGAAMGLRVMSNSAIRVFGPPLLGLCAATFGLASAPLVTAAVLAGSAWLLARR